ncbi:hypothetical protein ACWDUL_08960 [Nocardia niigatensis]
MSKTEARKELKSPVYKVVSALIDKGFTLRLGGHKFSLYCPCGGNEKGWTAVNGSPKNPDNHAQQLARWARRCPEGPH